MELYAASPDLGPGEVDSHSIDLLSPRNDLKSLAIHSLGHLDPPDVDHRGKVAFSEYVDQHGDGKGIIENGILRVDVSQTGNGMLLYDGNELRLDEVHHPLEQLGMKLFVGVEAVYQQLAGMLGKFRGQWNRGNTVVGRLVQLERALVLQLVDDPLLNLDYGALGIDEVIMENLSQGSQ